MRIGLNLGPIAVGNDSVKLRLVKEAERLGYSVVWVEEGYGADAPTVLSWLAAQTQRIGIGSGVLQMPARTPVLTAMTAATLDILSSGRFHLGLGVSGPQVSAGLHGVGFHDPLGRTREYVDVVRQALSGQRIRYQGEHFELPLPASGGKQLAISIRPVQDRIPVYLAANGPRNLELTGEIADGWLPAFFSPKYAEHQIRRINAGAAKAGRSLDGFDIAAAVPLVAGDNVGECADVVRPFMAFCLGGMGSRTKNFYNDLAARMGFAKAAAEIQDRFLVGDYARAAAAVPLDFLDSVSLFGSRERMADRMQSFANAGVTTLVITPASPQPEVAIASIRIAVEAMEEAGLA